MAGLMRWKKRSQSLIDCWISRLCLPLSPTSHYTLWTLCTSCSRSLDRDSFLTEVESTSENICGRQTAAGCALRSGTELMNDFYGEIERAAKTISLSPDISF